MLQPILRDNLTRVAELLKVHKVKRAYAFGSVCTEHFTEESDIDLLIAFEKVPFDGYAQNFWDLEAKLQKLLNRQVDLVPEHTLRNPYFIRVVNKTKTPIYE
jgi:predicted nucleotidyltransferase